MKLERALKTLIIGGLFLIPFIPLVVANSFFFPFITGKAFMFRILVEILFGLWLILAIVDHNYRPRRSAISIAGGSFLIILVLATIFSQNPYRSFWSNFERMEGLITYLHLAAYFLVLGAVLKKEKLWFYFLNISIAVCVLVGLAAIYKAAVSLNLPPTPLFQRIWMVLHGSSRIDGSLGNPIYLAVYMLVHIFLTGWLWLKTRRQSHWAYVYLPVILLELATLYDTGTRGTLLGLFGGLIVTSGLMVLLGRKHRLARRISLGALLGLVILGGGFWLVKDSAFVKSNQVLERFASISLTEQTTESRLTIWGMSLQGFREHPLLGWGPENYNLVFNKYYQPKLYRQEQWFDRSHDIFFDWLISAGLLGLLGYLSLFVIAFYYLWRRRSSLGFTILESSLLSGLLVAYFIHNIFVFDNLISYLFFIAFLAYLHARSTQVPTEVLKHEKITPLVKRPLAQVGVLVVAVGTIFIIYFFNAKALNANQNLIRALNAGNAPSEELALFKKVLAANTFGTSEAREQLMSATLSVVRNSSVPDNLKQEFFQLTAAEMIKQAESYPADARYQLFAGSFFNNFSQTKQALPYLEKAHELSPQKQTIMFELVGAYLSSGDKVKALAVAKAAFDLDQNFGEARKTYALVAIYNNQLPLAATLLRDGAKDGPGFLLDERLVRAYGAINQSGELSSLWQEVVNHEPDFKPQLESFLADLRQRGIIK